MKIRKATKNDLNDYLNLKKQSLEDYSRIIGEEIKFNKKSIKKEFGELLKHKNNSYLFFAIDKKRVGYLIGTFILLKEWKQGYIDDIFVIRGFRKRGVAMTLIKEFEKTANSKKIKRFKLGVNMKNINAIGLYEKIGYSKTRYEMEKRLK